MLQIPQNTRLQYILDTIKTLNIRFPVAEIVEKTGFSKSQVSNILNIKVDLYSLKHKNLDEIAAYLSIKEAQKLAGHESKVITMRYALNEKQRENDRLREVPNVLGG